MEYVLSSVNMEYVLTLGTSTLVRLINFVGFRLANASSNAIDFVTYLRSKHISVFAIAIGFDL